MRLEAVRLGRRLAVVAHGGGDEMVLDVGVVDAGRGAHEGGASKWLVAPRPVLKNSHSAPISALEIGLSTE